MDQGNNDDGLHDEDGRGKIPGAYGERPLPQPAFEEFKIKIMRRQYNGCVCQRRGVGEGGGRYGEGGGGRKITVTEPGTDG